MRLVTQWRKLYRYTSVQLNAAGIFVFSLLLAFPDYGLQLWASFPQDLKDRLPSRVVDALPLVFFFGAIIARNIKQPKLKKDSDEWKLL